MGLKDTLISKLESQIDAWDKEIEATKAEAEKKEAQAETDKAGAQFKEEVMDTVQGLQSNIESARKKIKEIQNAGEDRIDDFKAQIDDWLNKD